MRIGPVAVLSVSLSMLCLLATPAAAQNKSVAQHWEDFCHYVQIAKPDLALGEATFLVQQAPEGELLAAVEASRFKETYTNILDRARKTETLKDITEQLAKKLQDSLFKRAREPERIKADIQKLNSGERARGLALERLRAAGQFASKELLKTLLNGDEEKLHPYVLAAMTTLGRDVVYPLSEALNQLEEVPMQQVAEVLGEIGYPLALPYLKRVMEDTKVNAHVRSIVTQAYNRILKSNALPEDITAAQLFLLQANRYYTAASDPKAVLYGTDPVDNTGVIWVYNKQAGLVDMRVPPQVFGDVLAHRAAREALKLQPDLDAALSLWLGANLRRENRLADGKDETYPPTWQPPIFYLKASHPHRSHDVLERALADGDPDLARDAIEVLGNIAGTEQLINQQGTIQPILKALSYPDRRVRYEAAFALTNARPKKTFTGSFRVVPVLAEAVRQTENRYALVIASNQDRLNAIKAALDGNGYQSFGALSIEQAADELNLKPGVDLVVTDLSPEGVAGLYQKTVLDYKLAAVPVLVLADKINVPSLGRTYDGNRRMFITEAAAIDAATLKTPVETARSSYAGKEIAADEALKYASTALTLLRELSMSREDVYNVTDALPSLLEAVKKDSRQEIVKQAAGVLAVLDSVEAQKTLANAALDENRPEDTRISLLGSLAESATHFGARVSEVHLDNLHKLVETAKGPLAIAAARTYGALAQPTPKIVDFITR